MHDARASDGNLPGRVYRLEAPGGSTLKVTVELWLTADLPEEMSEAEFFAADSAKEVLPGVIRYQGAMRAIKAYLDEREGQGSAILRVISGGLIKVLDPDDPKVSRGSLDTHAW